MKCIECAMLALVDAGYSNYTVEETVAHCVRNANPYMPGITGYGTRETVLHEERECVWAVPGKYAEIDVDREQMSHPDWSYKEYFNTDEAKAIVEMENWKPQGE